MDLFSMSEKILFSNLRFGLCNPLGRTQLYNFHTESGQKTINDIIEMYKIESIIDYGCGTANGTRGINIPVVNYDPAIVQYQEHPVTPADLVVSYNVLNNIEEEYLPNVLEDIVELSNRYVLFSIQLGMELFREVPIWTNELEIYKNKDTVFWINFISKYLKIKEHFYTEHMSMTTHTVLTTNKTYPTQKSKFENFYVFAEKY